MKLVWRSLGLATSMCWLAFSQQDPTNIPDSVLYRVLFDHVQTLDSMAAHLTAAGKNPKDALTLSKEAQITTAEEGIVKGVALSCTKGLAALKAKAAPLISQGRGTRDRAAVAAISAQLKQIDASTESLLNGCVQQLREDLGAARFAVLDRWVRTRFAPSIHVGNLPDPSR
jgi:hypothetical protein